MTGIQWIWELSKQRYSRLAPMPWKFPVELGDNPCWYAEMKEWFESHGISINKPPLFRYGLACPHLSMTKVEKYRVIQIHITKLNDESTWISPTTSLGRKMSLYRALFYKHWQMDLTLGPLTWIHIISCAPHSVIGRPAQDILISARNWHRQICTKSMKEYVCQLSHHGMNQCGDQQCSEEQ